MLKQWSFNFPSGGRAPRAGEQRRQRSATASMPALLPPTTTRRAAGPMAAFEAGEAPRTLPRPRARSRARRVPAAPRALHVAPEAARLYLDTTAQDGWREAEAAATLAFRTRQDQLGRLVRRHGASVHGLADAKAGYDEYATWLMARLELAEEALRLAARPEAGGVRRLVQSLAGAEEDLRDQLAYEERRRRRAKGEGDESASGDGSQTASEGESESDGDDSDGGGREGFVRVPTLALASCAATATCAADSDADESQADLDSRRPLTPIQMAIREARARADK